MANTEHASIVQVVGNKGKELATGEFGRQVDKFRVYAGSVNKDSIIFVYEDKVPTELRRDRTPAHILNTLDIEWHQKKGHFSKVTNLVATLWELQDARVKRRTTRPDGMPEITMSSPPAFEDDVRHRLIGYNGREPLERESFDSLLHVMSSLTPDPARREEKIAEIQEELDEKKREREMLANWPQR